MPRFAVTLEIRAAKPLTRDQLDDLDGGRWAISVQGKPRGRYLAVTMTMTSVDAVGAIIRASNHILDHVPGEVRHAAVTQAGPQRRAP